MSDVCNLAHKRTVRECKKKGIQVDCTSARLCGDKGNHVDGSVHYTKKSQEIFDRHYDGIIGSSDSAMNVYKAFTKKQKLNNSTSELATIIYDTLMHNTNYEQLDTQDIIAQELYASDTEPSIRFDWRGKSFEILISEIE